MKSGLAVLVFAIPFFGCLDLQTGRPYPCDPTIADPGDGSGQCASGWRCGIAGQCVQPLPGELSIQVPDASIEITLVTPLLPRQQPDFLAVSPLQIVASSPPETPVSTQRIALLDDAGVLLITRQSTHAVGFPGSLESFSFQSMPVDDTHTTALAQTQTETFLQNLNGLNILLSDGGTLILSTVQGSGLRQPLATLGAPAMISLSSDAFWIIDESTGNPSVLPGTMPPGSSLIDLATYSSSDVCPEILSFVAVTDAGVWTADWHPPTTTLQPWGPVALPGLGDPSAVLQLFPAGDFLAVSLAQDDGGVQVALWGRDAGACGPPGDLLISPCNICSGVIDAIPLSDAGVPALEVRCIPPDSFSFEQTFRVTREPFGGGCLSVAVRPNDSLNQEITVPQFALSGYQAYAGQHAEVWFGDTFDNIAALTLDRSTGELLNFTDGMHAVVQDNRYDFVPRVGLVWSGQATAESNTLVTQVQRPADSYSPWYVFKNGMVRDDVDTETDAGQLSLFGTLAQLDNTVGAFPEPYQSVFQWFSTGSDGELIVTSSDSILAAPITSFTAFEPARLQLRALPAPSSPIESIALRPASQLDVNTPVITGYALTSTGLYSFEGTENSQSWSTALIALAARNGSNSTPVRVWSAGSQTWIGFTDGTVYSLPSGVQVSSPFDLQTTSSIGETVHDFGHLCGVTYALTQVAMYRLTPDPSGGPLGTWEPLQQVTDTVPIGNDFSGFYMGQLRAFPGELEVVTAFGAVAQLKSPGCIEP